MPRSYHVLAGLCRDIRNAVRDSAEGSETAALIVDEFNDVLELCDTGSDGDLPGGQEGDGSASGDDAESEDVPVPGVQLQERGLEGVGGGRRVPAVHSTRARAREERRRPARQQVLLPKGSK